MSSFVMLTIKYSQEKQTQKWKKRHISIDPYNLQSQNPMHTNIQSFFCLFWFLCFKDISGPYADFYSAPKQTCFVLSICSFSFL